jgi:hypothetical protein
MNVDLDRHAFLSDWNERPEDCAPPRDGVGQAAKAANQFGQELAMCETLRPRNAEAASRMSLRDRHRNRVSTKDLAMLLNAVLDVIGVPVTERCYAKSLAAMESAALEGQ